ncbi:MAG: RNA polymerase factor sigma-54 [Gemmatimonadales bacterium]|nr:RNA polymerase factor sigma-54 [Gemmatimonadales bacterium]
MRQGLSQSTSLRQELRINPRLYQAMDLLYMPMMDLQQHLKQELLSNPFLELVEPEEEQEAPAQTAEAEKEKLQKEDETDWEEILLNGFEVGGQRQQYEELEYAEPVAVETTDLADHLREQLRFLELSPKEQMLAEEFLGNITDEGWLGVPLEDIVRAANEQLARFALERAGGPVAAPPPDEPEDDGDVLLAQAEASAFLDASGAITATVGRAAAAAAGTDPAPAPPPPSALEQALAMVPEAIRFTLAEAEAMLVRVQSLDPAGVGARDLRECLLLQLRERGAVGSLTWRLVDETFTDLVAHRWNDLAKRFAVPPVVVQAAADQLARLDPKPGLKYSARGDDYIIPDLVVTKVGDRYMVSLNDGGMPRLRLSRTYQDVARDRRQMTTENREFIAQRLNSANWMIQAIEQRRQTMLKVMNFIVDRQREFFEKGVEYLKPLTLREVAEVINMHESTVSRVTNEKFVQTPRGVLPLKFFFSSALSTVSGEDASARAIRAKLEKLVADEDTARPLTDQQIVHLFQEQGIQIARRTVAKYRDQLGILPARMRKRV